MGSVDIPVGTVSNAIGQVQQTYPVPTILKSRALTESVLNNFPEVLDSIDKKGTGDWELVRKKVNKKYLTLDDTDQGALRVGFLWKDPQVAADVANAYVIELKRILTVLNADSAKGMGDFIERQLHGVEDGDPGVQQKIEALELEIADYKTREGILALEPQAEQLIKTAAVLQEEYTSAEVDLAESRGKLVSIRRQGDALERVTADLYSKKDVFNLDQLDSEEILELAADEQDWRAVPLAKSLEDPTIITLRRTLATLENERAEKRLLFTDSHPTLIKIRKDIVQAKAQLSAELSRFSDAFKADLATETLALEARREAARRLMVETAAKIEEFPEKERELLRMERDRELLNKVYILMAQELEQTRLAEQAEDTTFTLLDVAIPPTKSASPRRLRVAGAVFAVFLLGGLLWGASEERKRSDRVSAPAAV